MRSPAAALALLAALATQARAWDAHAAPQALPFDLSGLQAEDLLGPRRQGRLHALADRMEDFHGERRALVLVHGLGGRLPVLQGVVNQFRGSRYQLYIFAYDSGGRTPTVNGDDLARELLVLARESPGARRGLALVAHSLGGIVTRRALNVLAAGGAEGLGAFRRVRFVAVDVPWHGMPGPTVDRDSFHREVVVPRNPLIEMQARSGMFGGEGAAGMDRLPQGLLTTPLPSNVEIDLLFAQEAGPALDYTEGALANLPSLLVRHFRFDEEVFGDPQVRNFWDALIWSRNFPAFHDELSRAAAAATLDRAAALAALERHYPRFPGDHNGVLARTGPGTCLERIAALLGR